MNSLIQVLNRCYQCILILSATLCKTRLNGYMTLLRAIFPFLVMNKQHPDLNNFFRGCSGSVPEGADAVVQVEFTEAIDNGKGDGVQRIRILKAVNKGHDIRPVVFIYFSHQDMFIQSVYICSCIIVRMDIAHSFKCKLFWVLKVSGTIVQQCYSLYRFVWQSHRALHWVMLGVDYLFLATLTRTKCNMSSCNWLEQLKR